MQETEGTSSAMVDSAAEAESSRLGNALVELETEGIAYGDLALTITLHGELEQTETAGRRHPPHLCGARRQGDPGRLRPARHLVLPTTGAAEKAAGPIRLCFGGRGGLHGSDIRAADR